MSKGKWDTTAWGNGPRDGAGGEYTSGENSMLFPASSRSWREKVFSIAKESISLQFFVGPPRRNSGVVLYLCPISEAFVSCDSHVF